VIHCDHKPRSIYDHLSEEAIDRHCMRGTTGSAADDAHLSMCLACTQRASETSEFLRILDRAVEALVTGRAPSSSTPH
jgi:hypothetical protein